MTGVLLVVAIVAFAILGYTTAGNQFLADQIASRVSTPDMQIRIEGARGLLAGRFRIERISVADTSGPFAEIDDLAIDWSPFSLLTAEFEADRIAAARIDIQRPPIQTVESEPSEGSFNLPVEIVIRSFQASRSARISSARRPRSRCPDRRRARPISWRSRSMRGRRTSRARTRSPTSPMPSMHAP